MRNLSDIPEIREKIHAALPPGRVVPRHTGNGHFYEVRKLVDISAPLEKQEGTKEVMSDLGVIETVPNMVPNVLGRVFPSVTGKIAQLKDPGLMNYKMNRAVEHFVTHIREITPENVLDHAAAAKQASDLILEDASDIGTEIHEWRQRIFDHWIASGEKSSNFVEFIPPMEQDIRAVSAIRALQSFVEDYDYHPVACELFVYSHKLEVSGTLDDLGMMRRYLHDGDKDCAHDFGEPMGKYGKVSCLKCPMQFLYEFVLMDIKSSNQLKDHYFYQVALYWEMFRKLLGFQPARCVIVQLSKTTGKYALEDLKRPAKLAQYSKHMLKLDEGTEFIKSLRKNNQKTIITL